MVGFLFEMGSHALGLAIGAMLIQGESIAD